MKRLCMLILAISVVFSTTNCASMINLAESGDVYGGTYLDVMIVANPFTDGGSEVLNTLTVFLFIPCLIDLPLSLAMDTLTLPYTLLR